jgi:hypothetical protein
MEDNMKKTVLLCVASCVLWAYSMSAQTTYFVATNGGHVSPYTSWANAATNIHDAVALAGAGDTVWVTNGSYRLTNTIAILTNFVIRSVNGPDVTTLYRDASAGNFRLLNISNVNAWVTGFTLTNGYLNGIHGSTLWISSGTASNCLITRNTADGSASVVNMAGGALVDCIVSNNSAPSRAIINAGSGGLIEGCLIVSNSAQYAGVLASGCTIRRCRFVRNNATGADAVGGVYLWTGNNKLENSLIANNRANGTVGGVRVDSGNMVNCTVAGNVGTVFSCVNGARCSGGTITNCIIYGNGDAAPNNNYYGSLAAVRYSCAPELTNGAQGNVTGDPKFVNAANEDFRLALGSPCLDAGTNLAGIAQDVDRQPRPLAGDSRGILRHDMGAYEREGAAGALDVGFSGSPVSGLESVNAVFSASVAGTNTTIAWWGWDFDNNGVYDLTGPALAVTTNTFAPGWYSVSVRVTNSAGETATSSNVDYVLVASSNVYVSPTGGNVMPYVSWGNAATNIHDAIRVAVPGCTIRITNGSYRLTNQLAVYSGFALRSVNGPASTTLYRDSAFGNFRLLDIRHADACVSGLTLTNGYRSDNVPGSAVYLLAGLVGDCVIERNRAASAIDPAGIVAVHGGRMTACILSNNAPTRSVVDLRADGIIENCFIASNTAQYTVITSGSGTMRRCRIVRNGVSGLAGVGGVYLWANNSSRMESCLVADNTVSAGAGSGTGGIRVENGALHTVLNCTVAGNSSVGAGSVGGLRFVASGGGINCIVHGNQGNVATNYSGDSSLARYSCAPELTAGSQGNVTEYPNFRDASHGDYRLRGGSPCVNKGTNQSWMASDTDLDGNPRLLGGTVDMGAYETAFQCTIFMIR